MPYFFDEEDPEGYLNPENLGGFLAETGSDVVSAASSVANDPAGSAGALWDAIKDQHPLDQAALATSPVPVLGDVTGAIADARMYAQEPESRTWPNMMLSAAGLAPGIPGASITRQIKDFDPRFGTTMTGGTRVGDKARGDISTTVEGAMPEAPSISLGDLEGKPFVTTMSDRTAAGGMLTSINDVELNTPVKLRGGQDYMFENPGQVWASADRPVDQIMGMAGDLKKQTGQDPLLIPWRMAPTGGDFASMTGETMLGYASANMRKGKMRQADRTIKKLIPGWKGIEDPASIEQFRGASDQTRKNIKQLLDVEFRERGLTVGEARLAVADPKQLQGKDAGIMNVGQIDTSSPVLRDSGHPSYPSGVPGSGIGRLGGQEEFSIFDLLPGAKQDRPMAQNIRALQMKPYGGVITEDILKKMGL